MAKIETTQHGCWEWRGYTDAKGYGQFWLDGMMRWSHRVSYAIFFGTVPEGLHIDHLCGNPGCVNPDHMRAEHPSHNSAGHNEEEIPT